MLDYLKRQAHVAIFGDQIVSPRLDEISVQFQYNIATKDIISAVTGSGVVEHDGTNMMRVRAGTGSAVGTAYATSVDTVRYRTGHDIFVYFTCRFSAPDAGCSQYIGLFDANDGIGIGYSGTTFGIVYRSGGVEKFIGQAYFSKTPMTEDSFQDGIGYILDPSKVNLYRINFGYLGIAPIIFEVFGGFEYGWVPFHIMEFTNKQTGTHLAQPILPMRVEVASDGTAVVDVHTPSWNAGLVVDDQTKKADRNFSAKNSKAGITTETNVITLKNLATFQAKTNRIVTQLTYLSVSVDGTKNATIRLVKNTTLGGSPSYADQDATNSVTQKDVAGTTLTGGTEVFSIQLDKTGRQFVDLTPYHIRLQPGDIVTLGATSASSTDVFGSIGWRELF
jgi:hypothetical protein